MDLFAGLTPTQIQIVHRSRAYQEFDAGQVIFNEGDEANSLFTILSGQVEVFRADGDKDYVIAGLGTNEVFGEMGLLTRAGRTASVRAVQPTLLFEIPINLIEVLQEFTGPEETLRLLQNLICILGERLRASNEDESYIPPSEILKKTEVVRAERYEAIDTLERNLPKGLSKTYAPRETLKAGDTLCNEGEESDSFFFIHKGELEIVKGFGDSATQLATIRGPLISGELGFFTNEARSATIRALTDVQFTTFSGMDYLKLRQRDPDEAMNVLFSAARLAVYLMALGYKKSE